MKTFDLQIGLTDDELGLLVETNWLPDEPNIEYHHSRHVDDLVRLGVLFRWSDRSVHLTGIGEEILEMFKKVQAK